MNKTIMNKEKDPYLREIWAEGYDCVRMDFLEINLMLYKQKKLAKKIPLRDFYNYRIKIESGVSFLDGSIHSWIKESDGSADKFRELIKL